MTKQKSKENKLPKAIDQWQRVTASLRSYKITCMALAATIAILSMSMWGLTSRGPVVVIADGHSQVYLKGEYKGLTVDKKAVAQFLKEFLKARYEWKELSSDLIYRQISPLSTTAFRDKIVTTVKELLKKDFKDKKVSQSITNISIKVDKERVFASFDKLIRIEGIPLPIPTQAVFQLTTGSRTQWNPVGLYVNGIIEHEGK